MDRRKRRRLLSALQSGILEDIRSISNTDIASFTGDGRDLVRLVVGIEPGQAGSGDPSPDNVRPIIGWTEVNVWRTGKNLIPNGQNGDNGYIANTRLLVDGTTTADSSLYVSEYFSVKAGVYYTWSGASSLVSSSICFYDASKNFISGVSAGGALPKTITTPANAAYARANQYVTATSTYYTQLELGSSASAYEAYSGNSYTIPLGQTVYGGTLDVTSGKLTVDRAMVDMGALNWVLSTGGANIFTVVLSDRKYSHDIRAICSVYPVKNTVEQSTAVPNNGDKTCCFYYQVGQSYKNFYVYDTDYSDAASFKTAMNGVQLVYELATPIEVQLTPTQITTLSGANNIWADTGDIILLEYMA